MFLICIIGLPIRTENIALNGYISDDAWWHYRQIKEVVDSGKRMNPDIYEFASLNRPMTYPPLFHYLVAFAYKVFGKGLPLIRFTHYFNILEAILYILLVYLISRIISGENVFSLIGALAASVSYGFIIRARAGELMPFVPADLLALGSIFILLKFLKNPDDKKKANLFCLASGVLMGLSFLSWSGTILIYAPLVLFAVIALFLSNPQLKNKALKLFCLASLSFLVTSLPWYLPSVLKYGINPHSKEMEWFMQGFTVLHQVKPLSFYILTSGVAIFFVPIVFLSSLFKRDAVNIFLSFWIVLGLVAAYTGWRGYVAVMPVISAIAMGVGLSRIIYFFLRQDSKYIPVIFCVIFLLVGAIGYHISDIRISPLDPKDINEIRTNERSIRMLEFLKSRYLNAISIDHIMWISEDAAAGSLRMVSGQYLEYLPAGSSEVFKDVSRVYLADEEAAYKICRKHNVDLIIVRKQLLQLPQLSILFAPPGLKSEDYLKVTKQSQDAAEMTINFTPKGTQTMLFRMLNRQPLKNFELVYADQEPNGPLPFAVVYKVIKTP